MEVDPEEELVNMVTGTMKMVVHADPTHNNRKLDWNHKVKDAKAKVQSINQSDFYSTNMPSEADLNGVTTKSVTMDKISKAVEDINRLFVHAVVFGGRPNQRDGSSSIC